MSIHQEIHLEGEIGADLAAAVTGKVDAQGLTRP